MALYTLADRAKSTVETLLLIGDDHVHVKAADYALYPATGIFLVTVCKRVGNVESNVERCICTSKTSPDILNITRGQFDTVAAEHEVGELVQYRVNKAMLANMISELQAEIDADITAHVALPDPHAQYGLEAGGVSMSFVANANLFSSVAAQDSTLGLRGGLNAVGSGGWIQIYGKSHATAGALKLHTPNAAGDADIVRLKISGVLATAVATWADITHTGLKLSGGLDCNAQAITNISALRGDAGLQIYSTLLPETVGSISFLTGNFLGTAFRTRLTINSRLDSAVATWTYITHTGLKLSGALDADGRALNNVGEVSGLPSYGGLYINGSPFGATGVGIHLRTTGATPTFSVTTRLSISADVAVATATWQNIAHTGMVLSGDLLPSAADGIDLGSVSKEIKSIFIGDAGRLYFGLSQLFNVRTVANHLEISDGSIVRQRLSDNGEAIFLLSNPSTSPGVPQMNLYNLKAGEVCLRFNRAVDDTGAGAMVANPWIMHIPPSLVAGDYHLIISRDTVGNYLSFDSDGHLSVGYAISNTADGIARFGVIGGMDEVQTIIRGHSTQTNNIFQVQKSDTTPLFTVTNAGVGFLLIGTITSGQWGSALIRNVDNEGLEIYGGTNNVSGQIGLHGKSSPSPGQVELFTTNATDDARLRRFKITGHAAIAVATWSDVTHVGLTLSNDLNANSQGIVNVATLSIIANTGLQRTIDSDYWTLSGGAGTGGKGALVTLAGKSHASTGKFEVATPNAAGDADVIRLKISGVSAVAVATWTNVTHTGLKLSGALDANGQTLLGVGEVTGLASYSGLYINGSTFGVTGVGINLRTTGATPTFSAITRLTISADADVAVATWQNITHTGLKLSGGLNCNTYSLSGVGEITGANATSLFINGSPFGVAGKSIVLRTTGVTPTFSATVRLTISADLAVAIATWADITHTGLVLSGDLSAQTNKIIFDGVTASGMLPTLIKLPNNSSIIWRKVASDVLGAEIGFKADNELVVRSYGGNLEIQSDANWDTIVGFGPVGGNITAPRGLYMETLAITTGQQNSGKVVLRGRYYTTPAQAGELPDTPGNYPLDAQLQMKMTGVNDGHLDISIVDKLGSETVKMRFHDGTGDIVVMSGALTGNATQNLADFAQLLGPIFNDTFRIGGRRPAATSGAAITVWTRNAADGATDRLAITGGVNTAVATWSDVTHTGLKLSGALDANSQSITSVTSVTFVANAGIQRTVDNDYLMLMGGTGTGGKGALVTLVGKSHGTTGKLEIATPNAAGNADVTRLVIAGVADIAVATWSNVLHSGLKLSGTLDANDQIISNVTGMSMKGAPQDYCVFNAVDTLYVGMRGGTNAVGSGAFIRMHGKSHATVGRFSLSTPNATGDADVERLRISGVLATAVATWSTITHTGLVLSGGLNCNTQGLSGVTEISGIAAGAFFINGSPWGAAGSAIVLRTTSATPTFGATVRLTISADADVVSATWAAITQVGLKLGSSLDFNSWNVSNVWEIYGAAAKSTLYINGSPFGSSGNNITIRTTGATPTFGAIARLTIGANADEVSADWANITHTGLKLGGTMTLNGQSFDAGAASATIITTGTGQGLNVKSSTVTSSDGANIKIYGNDTSPAADDIPASLVFEGMNSTPAEFGFGRITLRAKVVTAASEDSRFEFTLMNAGASNKVAEMTGAGILSVDLGGSGSDAQVDLFDKYDDALVLRQGIQQNNRELLANMGVLDRKDTGSGYMMNLQPMVRLLAGGIYQTRQLLEDTKEELSRRLEIVERKLLEQQN